MNETWITVVAILIMFGGPIAWAITNRVLTFLERSQMIQRGMTPPPDPRFMAQQDMYTPNGSADRMLRKGVVLAFIGLALTIGLSFIGYHESGPMNLPSIHPGPWLLGGLIPMFIGVAKVLLAVMSGANFRVGAGAHQSPPPTYGAYQKPPPPHVEDPIAPPPWAGRPSYEELQRPAPPPEKRP